MSSSGDVDSRARLRRSDEMIAKASRNFAVVAMMLTTASTAHAGGL